MGAAVAEALTETVHPRDSAVPPTVLITGAARGIGAAIVERLAPTHHLILAGRDREAMAAQAAALPSAEAFVAELTDAAAVEAAVTALELPRGLDAVVHSAGVLASGSLEQLTDEDWERSFDVNVIAVARLTRLLLPALRQARGTVVTINSGSGFRANPGGGAYAASKFALRALTDALRAEEAPHGVRVTSVHPGRVDSDMQRQLRDFEQGEYEPENYLRPQSVAEAVAFALSAGEDAVVDSVSVRPR
ncbi:SDR family oxidoreductase [Brachybacterium sp. EF45031]|uniref:SDR family oxidoreductase n=1 Tax=Brachybacterium sillae TaxID=2810536 RepID=UPI00217EAE61|nr:SDR family oxidoreductase [Brachybacterium sillae]MCS6712171.1 SDR family oxidoreductase [Brachybacterium sillae]